jgi:predicted DNA-binding transcriptional regulator AlpA
MVMNADFRDLAARSFQVAEDAAGKCTEGAQASHDSILTVQDVALLLRVPRSWIYQHTRSRSQDRLPCFKIGKYLRFAAADIRLYVEKLRANQLHRS